MQTGDDHCHLSSLNEVAGQASQHLLSYKFLTANKARKYVDHYIYQDKLEKYFILY